MIVLSKEEFDDNKSITPYWFDPAAILVVQPGVDGTIIDTPFGQHYVMESASEVVRLKCEGHTNQDLSEKLAKYHTFAANLKSMLFSTTVDSEFIREELRKVEEGE